MTCDDFEMNGHYSSWRQRNLWQIKVADGGMKIEMEVDDDVMQECIQDNFENITDTVTKEIEERTECAWDNSEITDEEKEIFLRILKKVMP